MPENDPAAKASPQAELARAAIETWIREKRKLAQNEAAEQRETLGERAAAFVCIKKGGDLRGCIGTFQPAHETLADEIVSNAINAASRDPRFPAVTESELAELDISVDVLSEPEPIPDASYLDTKKYGVIVRSGARIGLLLPDLEGVSTVEEQLEIARSKAGIGIHEPIQLYRFTVNRYY